MRADRREAVFIHERATKRIVNIHFCKEIMRNEKLTENIMLPLLLDGKIRDDQKPSAEILEVVGLFDRRKHAPRELSGGQRRVAIARALIGGHRSCLWMNRQGTLTAVPGQTLRISCCMHESVCLTSDIFLF